MVRYIKFNQKKITRLKREARQFQDDIVCAVGTDFMQKIAEAENRMIFDILNGLENEPTADVVPKSEVAREIFEEMKVISKKFTEKSQDFEFGYRTGIQEILAELKKKYMEESGNDR